jgi:hypothetical protein
LNLARCVRPCGAESVPGPFAVNCSQSNRSCRAYGWIGVAGKKLEQVGTSPVAEADESVSCARAHARKRIHKRAPQWSERARIPGLCEHRRGCGAHRRIVIRHRLEEYSRDVDTLQTPQPVFDNFLLR